MSKTNFALWIAILVGQGMSMEVIENPKMFFNKDKGIFFHSLVAAIHKLLVKTY